MIKKTYTISYSYVQKLLYLDSIHFPAFQVMRHMPALRSWNTPMMKRRIELEKKEKCLGKLEHHSELNPDEDQSGCLNLYQGADVYFEEEVENETTPGTKEVNTLFFLNC